MNQSSLISYFVVGVFGFLLALAVLSALRRRERARNVMVEQGRSPLDLPPALAPLMLSPGAKSKLDLGRELAPEVERLILAGDKKAAVELIHERAGLGYEEATRTVEVMERLL